MAHSVAAITPYPTRKYRLRNSPPSRSRPRQTSKQVQATTPPSSRGVLLPLQPNLRRLPSRLALFTATIMPSLDFVQLGVKRKRVTSTNENAHAQGRSLRKAKRRRGYKDQDSEKSDMDVDDEDNATWLPTDEDDEDDGKNYTCIFLRLLPSSTQKYFFLPFFPSCSQETIIISTWRLHTSFSAFVKRS